MDGKSMDAAETLFAHAAALYPICRSITGDGLRQTLRYIASHIPAELHEVPSGTPVLDWQVPLEWNVNSATLETVDGQTIVDFARHNLHLLQYSHPVDGIVPLEELQSHLHSLPDQPDLIPYRTAYYADTWGFSLPHRERVRLAEPAYRVRIDTRLSQGSLTYAECFLPGTGPGEVLLSVHCCHPSLANDNLSGIAVAIELARRLADRPRRYGYRFLFIPGTIGAITWLHFNRDAPQRVRHGLVLTCLGDAAPPTYKQSRRGNAPIDRYAAQVLGDEGHSDRVTPFIPYGYDERQYCSPGFDLPVGCLMRSPNGTFPEYHTSADDLSFLKAEAMADSLRVLDRILMMAERDATPRNTHPYGEPQLGRRGLYRAIGGQHDKDDGSAFDQMTLLWILNLADGQHSLLDIAQRSGKRFEAVVAATDALREAGLIDDGAAEVTAAAKAGS
jgi:aminopeptidase-like protein